MKTIRLNQAKEDGKSLRKLRGEMHVSPDDLAFAAQLTKTELLELERGEWGKWNKKSREEALEACLSALETIERHRNNPPKPKRKKSSRAASTFLMMTLACSGFASEPRREKTR